ncbi:hypothetical protein HME9302_02212 [Alteripontixanthobacter maritimus]|uniref:Uncharacterized protein n=1 Tax=Alteripontixanthobacter maritimus TaxID=2161824 RepID=A0A369QBN9_9SPHN|nr:hypothetical protein [Alteripontixanthobacter maritimus]RDC60995.1 hypothetical protein HME9302_02212 [Alteripontixanthobacter maritimus]
MAEIPVEKKSSMAWLWWLLLLLGIAALLWWLLAAADNDADVATVDPAMDETAITEPLDPAATAATAGMATYAIGDNVDLDGVRVIEATGDMAFTIDVDGEPMLVLFDQQRTANTATEGRFDINAGSIVDIEGTVRSASDALPTGVTADIPAGTEKYIYATELMTAAAQE